MTDEHWEISNFATLPQAPNVSVVVITYEHEVSLAQAIESIADQKTHLPFEIIIAEDCSTDRTRDIALTMQRRYPALVRVAFTAKNKGMNRNLRFALGLARAPYIAICEGDDFWIDSHKLERQVAALERLPKVDLALSRGARLHADGRPDIGWDYGDEERVISTGELFTSAAWVAPTASLLWRAKTTRSLPNWFDDAPFGDLFLIMAGSAQGGAWYDPAPTVAYRIAQPNSFTVRLGQSNRKAKIRFVTEAYRLLGIGCDHYGIDRVVMRDRLQDYLLTLGMLQLRGWQLISGLRTIARMDKGFVAEKIVNRMRRLLKGLTT